MLTPIFFTICNSNLPEQARRPAHKDRVQALAHVTSRGYLASASRDGSLRLWDEENFISKSDKSKALICKYNGLEVLLNIE